VLQPLPVLVGLASIALVALAPKCASSNCPDGTEGAQPALAPASATAATAAATTLPPGARVVTVVAYPLDAQVSRDVASPGSTAPAFTPLGPAPAEVTLAENESAFINVTKEGYLPETIAIDGRRVRVEVTLKRVPVADAVASAQSPSPITARGSGSRLNPRAAPPCTPCDDAPPPPQLPQKIGPCPPGSVVMYGRCEKL
jgi:hypothetical protein